MDYKFRKKPVEVEAFQITSLTRFNKTDWPAWLKVAWIKDASEMGSFHQYIFSNSVTNAGVLNTLEGPMIVRFGDYIIQGVRGELYPCQGDIFRDTYDRIKFNTRFYVS